MKEEIEMKIWQGTETGNSPLMIPMIVHLDMNFLKHQCQHEPDIYQKQS